MTSASRPKQQNPTPHQMHRGHGVAAYSTALARQHASEEEILRMARRLTQGDWGAVNHPTDIEQNQANFSRDYGITLGVYMARDGTILYAAQRSRGDPPTIIHPLERKSCFQESPQ